MKNYFQFTRVQKIGVVSLSFIIIALIVVLNVNNHRGLPDAPHVDMAQFDMVSLDSNYTQDYIEMQEDVNPSNADGQEASLFDFDPNTLGKQGWVELGFSDKQAASIIKYRESYGPFDEAEDVGKIYVISEEKYEEIKPFMQFNRNVDHLSENNEIAINLATQEDLESIFGIGPFYAKQTIAYRDQLGGFTSSSQFSEIEGLSEEGIAALEANTVVDNRGFTKLKINSASKDELRNHPYLNDWAAVAKILDYRNNARIQNFEILAEKGVLTEETIKKLSPYIDFE